MKLIKKLIISKHHYAIVGAPIERYSISDKPIDELLTNLKDQGVEINPNYSEKRVKYHQAITPVS